MVDTPNPARPAEAIAWHRKRLPLTKQAFAALTTKAKREAFTVAGAATVQLVADVQEAVARALQDGTDLEAFKAVVGESLTAAWVGTKTDPATRLETIFRTTTQTAYNAGRYAQATDPDTAAARPYWQFDAVIDGRTTSGCKMANGVILPSDDPWWAQNFPPRHFNAIPGDAEVWTKAGPVPARDVRPGALVLTHRRRWRRVTMALRKTVSGGHLLRVHLASGRVLRVTQEHPVLRSGPVAWLQAGNLQPGDVVFEYGQQPGRVAGGAVGHPEDAPPLAHEPGIAQQVTGRALAGPVVLSVNLDGHLVFRQGDVEDEGADGQLSHGAKRGEDGEQVAFWSCHVLPEAISHADGGRLADTIHVHRVASPHPLGHVSALQPPRPVSIPRGAVGVGFPVGDADLIEAGAHGDSMDLAPPGDRAVRQLELALQRPDAAAFAQVLPGDEFPDGQTLLESFHAVAVTSIERGVFAGDLYDFSVEDDETYVADGIVVHNCRATFHPLRASYAERIGITTRPPPVVADEGFGTPPT